MKKYIVFLCLSVGILSCTSASAQDALKREKKIDKKEAKSVRKDDRSIDRKGDKKQVKALKKSGKISRKDDKGKYNR